MNATPCKNIFNNKSGDYNTILAGAQHDNKLSYVILSHIKSKIKIRNFNKIIKNHFDF